MSYLGKALETLERAAVDIPIPLSRKAGRVMKSYVLLEKGILEERLYLLRERLTVGRMPSNDICPSDPTVSRQHAMVYLSRGQAIVEDLGSVNGTFVNGNRIQKSIISSGDTLRFGDVIFRFIQEEVEPDHAHLTETQEARDPEINVSLDDRGPRSRARRLIETLAQVPVLSKLEDDDLVDLGKAARLNIYDDGQSIILEGERSKSLYIILEGGVRVLTHDHEGKEIELEHLSENQMFGELSYLTGAPFTNEVQAMEETILCQLSYEAIREILNKRPVIKEQFEAHCRARHKEMDAKKREAGIIERRTHPRFNMNLPVSFSIIPDKRAARRYQHKVFRSFSQNISVSGIRIKVEDQALLDLPVGCRLRLEISLPHPWSAIVCSGTLKYKHRSKEGKNLGYLGVQFVNLPRSRANTLEEFLLES